MSKLTYEQIIEKLKEQNIDITNFATHFSDYYPETFNEEEIKAQKVKEKFYEERLKPYRNNTNSKEWKEAIEEYNKLPTRYELGRARKIKELGLGEIKEVDQYGGSDQGTTWYSVKYFVDHDVYMKVSGYYSSYEGIDLYGGYDSCCKEVKPEFKTITLYE